MAMSFGIHIGHMGGPLEEMRRLWKFADSAGFDWFSVSDHFQESPPRGGEIDCFEAITTLTAAAVETKRVRLGALVYCVAYRNPGLHAKSLTTIDHLSHGRVDCGLGAGWHEAEAKAYGYAWPRIGVREDMLEEYAQVMRMLFDTELRRSHFAGTHFRLENAPNNPRPLQPRVPIWIGGRGEKRTLRAAAKFADGWNAPYIGLEEWIHKGRVLDQWCETENREPRLLPRCRRQGRRARRAGVSVALRQGPARWLPARHTEGDAGDADAVPRRGLRARQHRLPRGTVRLGRATRICGDRVPGFWRPGAELARTAPEYRALDRRQTLRGQ